MIYISLCKKIIYLSALYFQEVLFDLLQTRRRFFQILFLLTAFSFVGFSQSKDSSESSVEFRIKKLIIDDFSLIYSVFFSEVKDVNSHDVGIVKSINIDSSSFLGIIYKVKVSINCSSICFGWTDRAFEYYIGHYDNKLYRLNGFFVSEYFSFDFIMSSYNRELVDDCLFSKQVKKKINRYYKSKKFEKITEYFYCNQLMYCNGSKLDRVYSRPVFTIPAVISHGI